MALILQESLGKWRLHCRHQRCPQSSLNGRRADGLLISRSHGSVAKTCLCLWKHEAHETIHKYSLYPGNHTVNHTAEVWEEKSRVCLIFWKLNELGSKFPIYRVWRSEANVSTCTPLSLLPSPWLGLRSLIGWGLQQVTVICTVVSELPQAHGSVSWFLHMSKDIISEMLV